MERGGRDGKTFPSNLPTWGSAVNQEENLGKRAHPLHTVCRCTQCSHKRVSGSKDEDTRDSKGFNGRCFVSMVNGQSERGMWDSGLHILEGVNYAL